MILNEEELLAKIRAHKERCLKEEEDGGVSEAEKILQMVRERKVAEHKEKCQREYVKTLTSHEYDMFTNTNQLDEPRNQEAEMILQMIRERKVAEHKKVADSIKETMTQGNQNLSAKEQILKYCEKNVNKFTIKPDDSLKVEIAELREEVARLREDNHILEKRLRQQIEMEDVKYRHMRQQIDTLLEHIAVAEMRTTAPAVQIESKDALEELVKDFAPTLTGHIPPTGIIGKNLIAFRDGVPIKDEAYERAMEVIE